MDRSKAIIFILFLAGACVLWFLLFMRKSGAQNRRQADKRKLKGAEKRIWGQVRLLVAKGNIKGAAQLLEASNMLRDAINLLEQHNHIKEAAGLLLRIQRPNRAAIIYARHRHWESAANCFELAKMPYDAAKCAREGGDLRRAADNFIKAKKFEDAAEALIDLGEFHDAARIHLELGNEELATEIYESLLDKAPDLGMIKFNERELKVMTNRLMQGNINGKFAVVLANHNKLVNVIKELIMQGDLKSATELHSKSIEDIGPQLIAIENFTEQQNVLLAELFLNVSNFEYAGMVYERLQQFEKAAETFEKAEKYARASYCYERAGLKQKSIILMHMANEKGDRPPSSADQSNNKFAIDTSQTNAPKIGATPFGSKLEDSMDEINEEELTQIIDPAKSNSEPKGPQAGPRWVPPPPTVTMDGNSDPSADFSMEEPFSSPIAPAPLGAPASSHVPPPLTRPSLNEPASGLSTQRMIQMAMEQSMAGVGAAIADDFENNRMHLSARDGTKGENAVLEEDTDYNEMMKLTPKSAIFNLIMTHPYFTELTKEEVDTVVNIIERHTYAIGDALVDFQVPASGMYFLNRGAIEYHRLENGVERHVETVSAPEIFGELWLLACMHANVKIIACKPAEVFVLNRDKLMALLHMNPDLAMKLYRKFTQRLVSRFLTPKNDNQKRSA